MAGNPGGPPDKWVKVHLEDSPTSTSILEALNNVGHPVTAAFTQGCEDGLFLFLGFYSQQQ